MLCDGDCGNCYHEEDLNRPNCGQDLCKECMKHTEDKKNGKNIYCILKNK